MNDDIKEVTANDEDFGFQKEPSWTSIDLYYKGFHVKKSFPNDYSIEKVIKFIEDAEALKFNPSWNQETNKAVQTTLAPVQTVQSADLGVCSKCGAKNALSKAGKIYCSARCWLPKQ